MRCLEILLIVSNLLPWVWPRTVKWLPPLMVALAGLHLWLEGYRWQMVPAYALTGLWLGVWVVLGRMDIPADLRALARRAWVRGPALMLSVALTATAPVLFPVPVLPTPTGPYPVGTLTYEWVDTSRTELYTPAGGPRHLMAQVWYPADSTAGSTPAPWMNRLDVAGPAIARFLRFPEFFLDHANLTNTHAYYNAPLASAQRAYPVIVYSHGWNGFRADSAHQMANLASHGFVVVAIDHPYGSMVTVFEDGTVALNNPQALDDRTTLQATYAADIRFVFDQLEKLTAGAISPGARFWAGRLDTTRLGVMGHSTGGGAALWACQQDPRCEAVLGLDVWLEPLPPAQAVQGVTQPVLLINSETWSNPINTQIRTTLVGASAQATELTLLGTRHYDFTLVPALSPLAPALGIKGPLAADRVFANLLDYGAAFFQTHLQGQPSPLLAGPAPAYPEMQWPPR